MSGAMKIPRFLTVILLLPLLVNAYTWQFTSQPRQCQDVSLSVQGSGGQPPYTLLIIPTGPSPLPNNTEVRTIQNIPFSGTSTALSFNLNYPENSSFVAVVSDQSGFGTGGASTSITVLQSSDSSCYSSSEPTQVAWFFYIGSTGGLTQCESVRLWWEAPSVNGTVNFYGTIPGGTSFAIPQGSLSNVTDTGTGFNWTIDIAPGTIVVLIGNDDRGIGSGGSAEFAIAYASNYSCLNNNSPSSTAGNPAGGSYLAGTSESPTGTSKSPTGTSESPTSTSESPTSTSESPTSTSESPTNTGELPTSTSESLSNGSHSSFNTSAIVGIVVGATIVLVSASLVAFWSRGRRDQNRLLENQLLENRQLEDRLLENQQLKDRLLENQQLEDRLLENRLLEDRLLENRQLEDRLESRILENRLLELPFLPPSETRYGVGGVVRKEVAARDGRVAIREATRDSRAEIREAEQRRERKETHAERFREGADIHAEIREAEQKQRRERKEGHAERFQEGADFHTAIRNLKVKQRRERKERHAERFQEGADISRSDQRGRAKAREEGKARREGSRRRVSKTRNLS